MSFKEAPPTSRIRSGTGHRADFRLAGLLVVCLLAACGRDATQTPPVTSPRGYPLADLEIRRGERVLLRLEVDVADTPEARGRGLMGVRRLEQDAGMAFLVDAPSRSPFYMKDTLIPLDIAFWAGDGRIVDILQMQPCPAEPCPRYYPRADYVGAVEVNLALLGRRGVRIGDVVGLQRRKGVAPTAVSPGATSPTG